MMTHRSAIHCNTDFETISECIRYQLSYSNYQMICNGDAKNCIVIRIKKQYLNLKNIKLSYFNILCTWYLITKHFGNFL